MLTVQGTAQKVFALRPPGRLSSVNLWGCRQLGMQPISFFATETLIFGFWVPPLLNNSSTPASHSFYRNQYTPGIQQKPHQSSKRYSRSLILILLNKPLSHREAKRVDMNLYHFLGDNELQFYAFWSGCVSQTFVALINTPEGKRLIWLTVSQVSIHSCSVWIFRVTMRQSIMADRVEWGQSYLLQMVRKQSGLA